MSDKTDRTSPPQPSGEPHRTAATGEANGRDRADCDRFSRALLEGAPAEEQDWHARHRELCPECALEERALALLADDGSSGPAPELGELARHRMIAEVVCAAEQARPTSRAATLRRRLALAALAAGLLLAAAGVVLGIAGLKRRAAYAPVARTAEPTGPRVAETAPLLLRAGRASIDSEPVGETAALGVGQRLDVEEGRVVLSLPAGCKVLAGARTGLALRALSGPRVELELVRGELLASVAPRPAGHVFAVSTRAGRVVVKGTLFRLRHLAHAVLLEVLEGRVRVELPTGAAREVGAGQQLTLDPAASLAPLGPGAREAAERDRRLFALLGDGGQIAARVDSEPSSAAVTIDGAVLGRTPVVVALRAGRRRLVVERSGQQPVSEDVDVQRGDVLVRDYRLAQSAPASQPASAPSTAPPAAEPRLRGKIDDLRAQVIRSRLRIAQLQEMLLREKIMPREVTIEHRHAMGRMFRVERVVYALDGKAVFQGGGELQRAAPTAVLDAPIAVGPHTLSVQMVLRGNGGRIFPYFEGYRFNVRSSYTFVVGDDRRTRLTVTAFENGGPFTAIEQLPSLKFELQRLDR